VNWNLEKPARKRRSDLGIEIKNGGLLSFSPNNAAHLGHNLLKIEGEKEGILSSQSV
jgi:hypothetical protein